MKPRVLSSRLVYFPKNGCVIKDGKILVRLVYGDDETTEVILEALKRQDDTAHAQRSST